LELPTLLKESGQYAEACFDWPDRRLRRREMIQTTGVDHVVLHVTNIERSKKFYTDVLGMTVYREDAGQVFMHAGQQGVALFEKERETQLAAGNDLNHLALNVAGGTYETLKAELEKAGVTVSGRPGEARCIYFRDPDGHRLQLMVRA
jgi:catechol 2,3-dioxygenase-like lactoylglutathione lyase family enzyme